MRLISIFAAWTSRKQSREQLQYEDFGICYLLNQTIASQRFEFILETLTSFICIFFYISRLRLWSVDAAVCESRQCLLKYLRVCLKTRRLSDRQKRSFRSPLNTKSNTISLRHTAFYLKLPGHFVFYLISAFVLTALYENGDLQKPPLLSWTGCDWKPIIPPVTEANGKFPPLSPCRRWWKDKRLCAAWLVLLKGVYFFFWWGLSTAWRSLQLWSLDSWICPTRWCINTVDRIRSHMVQKARYC